jgi:hypothetical protein
MATSAWRFGLLVVGAAVALWLAQATRPIVVHPVTSTTVSERGPLTPSGAQSYPLPVPR